MKKITIAQIGTFDVENFGDLLFPNVLSTELTSRNKLIEIDLFSPKGGKKPFEENVTVYPIKDLEAMNQKRNYQAIIIGGGDIIRVDQLNVADYEPSYISSFLLWQYPLFVAKKHNVPCIFNCPGVPIKFPENFAWLIKNSIDSLDYISVRDEGSKQNLINIGVSSNKIKIIPDTIFLVENAVPQKEITTLYKQLRTKQIIPSSNNYICVQHHMLNYENKKYIAKLKSFLKIITEKYNYDVFLFPIGYVHNDLKFLAKLNSQNPKISYIEPKLSPSEQIAVLANSKGFIGTSLHGILVSSLYNVPILAINDNNLVKIKGLLQIIKKERLEVEDINELEFVFEKHFFVQNNVKVTKIKEKIHHHFDDIYSIIINQQSNQNFNIINLLNEFYTNTDKLTAQIDEKISLIEISQGELEYHQKTIENMLNSKSWRVTKPLRFITNIIKKANK